LIKLNNINLIFNILINIFCYFFQDINIYFKNYKQELLIQSILLKVFFILIILPINIKKSLFYLFTSTFSLNKIIIIIIFLKNLKSNIFRKAKEFNIPYNIYKNNQEFKNLILINIKSIIFNIFIFNFKNLIESNSLNRIILKEYYLLISVIFYCFIIYRFKKLIILPI
jgi:hypothetical protein